MSRYLGPRLRVMRSLGTYLPGLSRKTFERKPYPPGMHRGASRRKTSVFGLQLQEKQKLRFHYGVSEAQLRRIAAKAFKAKGNPGENLLKRLEARLDNVVFRSGFSPSIIAARQLVTHGHVLVDGKKVDKPSYTIKRDQKISLTKKGESIPFVAYSLENLPLRRPPWLAFDEDKKFAAVVTDVDWESVPFALDLHRVVEYLSRAA